MSMCVINTAKLILVESHKEMIEKQNIQTHAHKQACRVCATQRFVVSSHNKQNMTL